MSDTTPVAFKGISAHAADTARGRRVVAALTSSNCRGFFVLTSSSAGAGGPTVERSRRSVSVPSAAFSRSPCGRAMARHQPVSHGCDPVIWRMP